jgi:hypothetical protein
LWSLSDPDLQARQAKLCIGLHYTPNKGIP